ncbi:sulfite exporter TauE/SafE family protein [Bradyrhizobium sp. USDA 4473]
MPEFDAAMFFLAATTCFAAFVNGAIGYGFSSLTVPLALLFYTNRILNPAIVIIEVFINVYVLLINLKGVPAVWRRVLPILLGLLPGIALGGYALASLQPGWIKFATYTIILPLILLQAAGWRRPIEASWLIGLPFGSMLGILYSVTTISGPPLAMLFNNQGLVRSEFRAGLALVRVVESSVTAFVYYKLGLFIPESGSLLYAFIPSVMFGIPLGSYAIRRLDPEIFRRICMSFDAWIVGFGLTRVLIELDLVRSSWAYSVMSATILIDLCLLYSFFTTHGPTRSERRSRRLNDVGGPPVSNARAP